MENIVIDELRKEDNSRNNVENNINKDNQITEEGSAKSESWVQLTLPYASKKGVDILAKMKKNLKQYLKLEIKPFVAYKSKELSTQFKVKDHTEFKHKSIVVYLCKCPEKECQEQYIGETKRRISERIIDHDRQDRFSHMLHHSRDRKHLHVWTKDFKILGSNYSSTTKRKISESLFIGEFNPTMNTQETSYPLKLFN